MTKYKEIIGGTQEELEEKFPWLKQAEFEDAVVELFDFLIWKDGVWKSGVWEYGVWEDGRFEGGVWQNGIFNGGVFEHNAEWREGTMWSCLDQRQKRIRQVRKFVDIDNNAEKET